MTIEVDVRHRLGALELSARFSAESGVTALFGPSGSGKTSLVNIVAGLIRPDYGRVSVGGTILVDTDRDLHVPPHRRRVGYVFQEGRLFPHLTVRQNLVYGRWFAPRSEAGADWSRVVEMLGLGALLDRRPAFLSGGEKQRVAIGRALLAHPRLMLMDEPLASLDEPRRAEILPFIERLRDETRIPILYVSHSIAEVARLAGTMVVVTEGRTGASGPAAEVMRQLDLLPPADRGESGAIVETTVMSHDAEYQLTALKSRAGRFHVPLVDLPLGAPVRIRVRARDVIVATRAPDGLSAINVLAGTVASIGRSDGPSAEVRIDCGGEILVARVTRRSAEALGLRPGLQVHAVVKSVAFDQRSIGAPIHNVDADSL